MANDACDASHVMVNGRTAKASLQIKEGDVITVTFGQKALTVRVKSIKESTRKEDAVFMYEVIEEA